MENLMNFIFLLALAVSPLCAGRIPDQNRLTVKDDCPGCTLKTYWGSEKTLKHLVRGIFVAWWDRKFDHSHEADVLLDTLLTIREDCLTNLGMADPPNPAAGHHYNVYLHHSGKDGDSLPNNWGMGQGTDPFGLPFLAIGYQGFHHTDTIVHEGFHVFQYSSNNISPGFVYRGDSRWYSEATANWYAASKNEKFDCWECGTIIGNPQLALWHSFNNKAPDDPAIGMYIGRQYGMFTLLLYLVNFKGVDRAIITEGFYSKTKLSPQEYIYTKLGASLMRSHFADWAAHSSAEMDYLSREQYKRGLQLVSGDRDYFRPSVWTATDQGTGGLWVRPLQELTVRGWAYNVFNITNTGDATYRFELDGDAAGSQGASSQFEGRVVVLGAENKFYSLEMSSSLSGQAEVKVSSTDCQVMLVVVSVPEFFGGYQTYGYQVKITKS